MLNDILTLLNWKRILTFDHDHKNYSGYTLVRKGLNVYGFWKGYPSPEDWKNKEYAFIANRKSIKLTSNNSNGGSSWAAGRLVQIVSDNSWRVTFKNHFIQFDELREENDSRWRRQCPEYYLFDAGKDKDGKNTPKKKIPLFGTMELAYDGNCLNLDSEEGIKAVERLHEYLDLLRMRTNRMAKARREEKKAIAAAEHAKATDNWLLVNPSDAFKIRNVSERRLYLDRFTPEEIVESMNPEVLDKSTINNSEYELIKFEIDPVTKEQAYYLKMLNPSTGETHLEGVGPYNSNTFGWSDGIEEETVEAALMWRDGEKMYDNKPYVNKDGVNTSEKVKIDYNAPVAIT